LSELSQSQLEAAIAAALPDHLRARAGDLAAAIVRAAQDGSRPRADPELLRALGGADLKVDGRLLDFGTGNQFGDIIIRDVVGGDKYEISLAVPSEPWRIAEEDVEACPYPGLAVFDAAQAAYFFGRDADIARLVRYASRPVVAVTGPSGVGKSSFVLAGVLPRLRADDPTLETLSFRISTGTELLRDLAATLEVHTGRPTAELLAALQSDDGALRSILLGRAEGRVVLVLDQFEELFVGADESRSADRARLLDMLLDIERQADPRLLVILTSRENYFEHPDFLARPELRPIVVERGVALAGLSDRQLREAIQRPLDAFNARPERRGKPAIVFENGVLDLLEQEFRRTERTLPLVQYLLRLLWTEQRELSKGAYTTLGGLERALDRHASKIYDHFDAEAQRLVRAVLLALVRPGIDKEYTRRRVARDELIGAGSQREPIIAVIGRLASQDSRIISEQQVGQVSYLELTHEILLRQWERLRVLIDTYRERLDTREQLLPVAEQWQQSLARTGGKGDSTYLYRGSQLRQARAYTRSNDLPEGVDTGIQVCYLASQRYQRRQVIVATAALVATVVVLAVGFNWFTADQRAQLAAEQLLSGQRATAEAQAVQTAQAEAVGRATAQAQAAQEAERAAREAEVAQSQRLANQARQLLDQGNRPLAVTLALEANSITEPPLQAQLALAEVAYAPGYARDLPAPPESAADPCVFETPAGRREIRVDEDQSPWTFVLYDAASNTPIRSTRIDGINGNPPVINDEFWPGPQWCAQVSPDGNYGLIGVNAPSVSAGSTGVIDGLLVLWDLTTGEQTKPFPDFAGQAYFSPDSRIVAYATLDDTIKIWDVEAQLERTAANRSRLPFFWSPRGDLLLTTSTVEDEAVVFAVDIFGTTEFVRWSGAGTPLGFAPDGASVYMENGSVQEWSLGNAAQMTGQRGSNPYDAGDLAGVQWIRFSEVAGQALSFATGPDSGTVLISSASDLSSFEELAFPGNEFGLSYSTPVMSADGSTALIAGAEGIYRFDLASGELRPMPGAGQFPGGSLMAISADGGRGLISDGDGSRSSLTLIDPRAETVLRSFEERDRRSVALRLSPDGRQAAAVHAAPDVFELVVPLQITVWNTETGERQYNLELDAVQLERNGIGVLPGANVTFSPDGTHLAMGFSGGNLQLLNATDGQTLWSVPAAGGVIAFSPDNGIIANGSLETGLVQLVNAADGALLTTLDDAKAPFAFSPDGRLIATGGVDATLRIFDVASGIEIRRFEDQPRDIVFATDGRSLFTGGEQGVKRWRVDSLPELIEWTRANRIAAPLTCQQRVLYQVAPLCPPGTAETAAPTATEGAQPTAQLQPTPRPTLAPAPSVTSIPPTPVPAGTRYRITATSDGFVAVRANPTRQSDEVQRLTAGTEIVCAETVIGEEIAGVNTWAYCPSVGGYIYRPLLEP